MPFWAKFEWPDHWSVTLHTARNPDHRSVLVSLKAERKRFYSDIIVDVDSVTALPVDVHSHFPGTGSIDQIGLTDEPSVLRGLIRSHWVNAPVFSDARTFFDRCSVPIYVITNNGLLYIKQALLQNGLRAGGVISADTARAYKPHREIFDEALRTSGCSPDEVVHIGDSYNTDVVGARSAGIRPVLLLRGRAGQHDDVETTDSLGQALDLILTN